MGCRVIELTKFSIEIAKNILRLFIDENCKLIAIDYWNDQMSVCMNLHTYAEKDNF